MDLEEYKRERKERWKRFQKIQNIRDSEIAKMNNPVKEGDVISNGTVSMKVETILTVHGTGNSLPQCVYSGLILTKTGKPAKKQDHGYIYQNYVKTINGDSAISVPVRGE